MRLNRYGVAWAPGGIAFLMQGIPPQNAVLPDLECPYSISVRTKCPHEIILPTSSHVPDYPDDPLFEVLKPIPLGDDEPRACLLQTSDVDTIMVIERLLAMSWPADRLLFPLWEPRPKNFASRIVVTNTAPIVFTGMTYRTYRGMHTISQMTSAIRRRVLFVTSDTIIPAPGCKKITTSLRLKDLDDLNLREIGAALIYEYMLHGKPFS